MLSTYKEHRLLSLCQVNPDSQPARSSWCCKEQGLTWKWKVLR